MQTLVRTPELLSNNRQIMSEAQPVLENVSGAGSKPRLLYKSLLNQYVQKLKKPPPMFQTQNDGSDHQPKFRSTVWIDGVGYPSSNTFNQRKMAEMDASKNAYIDLIQKSKNEALQLIREDRTYCKSIMAEYAAKMNIERPKYETSQQGTVVPVFRSCLVFNGVTYLGDCAKSKKEAEQLAARLLILKYLDSEFAHDITEIIISKFRQMAEWTKVHETNNIHNTTNVVVAQPRIPEASMQAVTPIVPVVTQPHILETSMHAVTPIVPKVTQPHIPEASVVTITPAAPVVTQPHIPQVAHVVVTQPHIPAVAPVVTQPQILEASVPSIAQTAPVVTRQPSEISFMGIMPPVSGPVALVQAQSVEINRGQWASNPSTDLSLEYIPLTTQTSDKKRNKKNRKNAQKKMRLDSQMQIPTIPASHVPQFSSQ